MFDKQIIQTALKSALADFAALDNIDALKSAQKKFSEEILAPASKAIGQLPPEERGAAGKVLSEARAQFQEAFEPLSARLEAAKTAELLAGEAVDVSTAAWLAAPAPLGSRHPLQVLMEDVADFFKSIGWRIAQGPEIEAEWFNFDSLNFGPDHPARQMQDTFYLEQENLVLRTHTSPVQVRSMLENGVPLYIACPGRVFRTDELDATHTPVFHQCEGLAVDKGLTMANLKGTIDAFAKAMFGASAKTRLRPSYFPFTEPSAEMDVWYEHKKGGAGWIEWGGCGMVNPAVLASCGLDPEEYTGFAFGMGIERTLMLRHDIQDMHDIVEGDVRFSKQFGFES